MGMPTWWGERRYGLFIHANLATVPAWAPIGQYADWYRSHVGEEVPDVLLHPRPMVEVVAHHRDRWGHIDRFDDFLPLLTFDRFDAEDWARLAVDAGMGYSVLVAKHHDGWCWWDAPNTERTLTTDGPRRNVVEEFAAACERNDVTFGTYYSLLDWGDARYPTEEYVDTVLHPHVTDLVERHGSHMLWGDGHWGHGPDVWKTNELLQRLWRRHPELVVNDRWWASPDSVPPGTPPIVRTFEYQAPDDIVDGPWELCRGIGSSFGHNRAERAEHHMTAHDIVALLTEVVAKGGNLLLNVGPALDGTIDVLQTAPLREAGEWVRRHAWLINRSRPWVTWGDDHTRYLRIDDEPVDGQRGVEHVVYAIDLDGSATFPAIDTRMFHVVDVRHAHDPSARATADRATADPGAGDIRFHQDDEGLHLDLPRSRSDRSSPRRVSDVIVYRLDLAPRDQPGALFPDEPRLPIDLQPLLRDATPGDIVQLGDGTYRGPATVPNGVVVRGLGAGRTIIDGGGATAVILHRNARLEHARVTGGPERVAWFPVPVVEVTGPFATVLGCRIDGHIVVCADSVLVRASRAAGVVVSGSDRFIASRCRFDGMRWDVGIHLEGGADHEVDSCEFDGHLCAVRASDTTGTVVRGTNISARWWGVHLQRTERAHVHGNFVSHTMRAIDIDAGTEAVVEGNAVDDGDSGCIVEAGASGCQVSGNVWERCRIGVLAWDATGLRHQDNTAIDLHEPEHATVSGP